MSVLKTTCPLTPSRLTLGGEAIFSERIIPETALDLERLLAAISPEVISKFKAGPDEWGVVSVLASHSATHVMVMNLQKSLYVPGVESLRAADGDEVFRVAGRVQEFLSRKNGVAEISVGVNWSNYSYGAGLEEQSGFASIGTKVHFHISGRSAPPEEGHQYVYNHWKAEWIPESDLTPQLHRLLVKNDYGELLGRLLVDAARKALAQNGAGGFALVTELADPDTWSFDARGACAALRRPLLTLTNGDPRLFSRVIQPIARAASDLLICLTEIFTDMNCSRLHGILKKVESGRLSAVDLAVLRAVPSVRTEDEIRHALNNRGLPAELIPVLLPAVRERCLGSDPSRMWRKGFGYALVLSGPVEGPGCELRIMPGVYLGPGGIVEAQRIILSRVPVPAPNSELIRRGRMFCELGRCAAA